MRFLSLLLFSAIGGLLHAQFTPSDLVITDIRNYLYDSTLSNVTTFGDTFFQSQSQIGTFQNQQGLLGIDSGLVFSSGKIDDINQSVGNGSILNRPGDTLLNTLIGVNSNDVSGVQFTFLALTDTLRIPFVFATKEYPSFFGSFNDGAGIFIKGPGYPSFTNIAKLTLSNLPVTALNIGNPSTLDSFLTLSSLPPPNLGGYTEKMETAAPVAIGQPYEVRIVVGDGGDYAFNSYLFVGRIKPPIYYPALRVNGQSVMGGGSILLDEGDSANLVFARTQTTDTDTISLALAGNASLGSDYLMAVDTLFMLPGQDSVSLTLLTFNECLNEGSEEIQLSWQATSQSAPGLPLMDSLSFVIEDFLVPDSLLQASAAVLCSGDTLPLGIPSVAGYSYQWSPFLGLSSQSGPQNLFSLDNPSNAVILQEYVVTATHPNGCSTTDSIQITVRPGLPPFSPLNQATCSQELIELGQPYDSTLGYQFQWLPDSHLSQAQTPNPIFQLVTTTPATYQYEMQVVDPWGCQTSTNVEVSVFPLPVLGFANDSLRMCSGDTLSLAPLQLNYQAYAWSGSAGLQTPLEARTNFSFLAQDSNQVFIPLRLQVRSIDNCTQRDTLVVTVEPKPIFNGYFPFDSVCVGDSLVMNLGFSPADSWSWDFGDGSSAMGWGAVTDYHIPGTYLLQAMVSAGQCQTQQSWFIEVTDCNLTAIEDPAQRFHIYPNPVHDRLHIGGSLDTSPLDLQLWDLSTGALLETWELGVAREVSLDKFAAGPYLLLVSDNQSRAYFRVLKH